MADIVLLIIVAWAAVIGYKKGFIHALFNFGSHLIAIITATICYPMVAKWFVTTGVYEKLEQGIAEKTAEAGIVELKGLPALLQNAVQSGVDTVNNSIAAALTDLIVTVVSAILVFFIVKLILTVILKVINTFARLPVVKTFNKMGGFALGLASGVVIAYIALAIVSLMPESQIAGYVNQSIVAQAMYNNNVILKYIFK